MQTYLGSQPKRSPDPMRRYQFGEPQQRYHQGEERKVGHRNHPGMNQLRLKMDGNNNKSEIENKFCSKSNKRICTVDWFMLSIKLNINNYR